MEAIRVLITDDQTITRTGLRALLETALDIEIVGEAANGSDAIEIAAALQPDVVLMDLRMPDVNGIEATRRIHRTSPHIGILILTVFDDDTSVFPAIRAGGSRLPAQGRRPDRVVAQHPYGCDRRRCL